MELQQMGESELQDRLVTWFAKWFDVYFEERSLCGKFRIDLLLYHKSDLDRRYPIGIELKKSQIKRGTDIGAWCAQAHSYTKAMFDEKIAHVFIAPQISGYYMEEGSKMAKHNVFAQGYLGAQHNVNSFLYRSFKIGELQKFKAVWPAPKDQLRLVMNCREIWSSQYPHTFHTEILDNL